MKIHALMVMVVASVAACNPESKPTSQAPAQPAAVSASAEVSPSARARINEQANAWVQCAITAPWAGCVEPFIKADQIRQTSVESVATTAARECKQHFRGKDGQDVLIITAVARQRLNNPGQGRGPIVVGKPQPLPPVDKKM